MPEPNAPSDGFDALVVEHERLKAKTEQLRQEHRDLESRPVDFGEHVAHRVKLRAHIEDLRCHIDKWRHRQRPDHRP